MRSSTFNLHALRRIQYIGVTFRTRTPGEVAEIARRMRADRHFGKILLRA